MKSREIGRFCFLFKRRSGVCLLSVCWTASVTHGRCFAPARRFYWAVTFVEKLSTSLLSSRYCATVWAAAGLEAEGRPINLQYDVPISKDGAAGFAPTLTMQRDRVGFAKRQTCSNKNTNCLGRCADCCETPAKLLTQNKKKRNCVRGR